MIPVVACNRQGTEILLREDGSEKQRITFYGRSFITDKTGGIVAAAENDNSESKPFTVLTSTICPGENRATRLLGDCSVIVDQNCTRSCSPRMEISKDPPINILESMVKITMSQHVCGGVK